MGGEPSVLRRYMLLFCAAALSDDTGRKHAAVGGNAFEITGVEDGQVALDRISGPLTQNADLLRIGAQESAAIASDIENDGPAWKAVHDAHPALQVNGIERAPLVGFKGAEPDLAAIGRPGEDRFFDGINLAGNQA